jgi:pimeloyl-ACP methyl ester carboxylesterase
MPMNEFFVGHPPHQMYVQHWPPVKGMPAQTVPVIMVHGGAHSGIGFTTTPDGRPGWALLLAERGWDVYVVDWPGVGRSGTRAENVGDTPAELVEALALLTGKNGPAAFVGHSIGAALAIKLAEARPHTVLALAALAPASAETPLEGFPAAPLGEMVVLEGDVAKFIFANSTNFPAEAFDDYLLSLVPFQPRIFNASVGLTDDFKIDAKKAAGLWNKRIPTLVLGAEDDATVPVARLKQTCAAMGATATMLGADWEMPGHGHMYPIEMGTEAIAARVSDWLVEAVSR